MSALLAQTKSFVLFVLFVVFTTPFLPVQVAVADEVAKGHGIPFIATNRITTSPGISYPTNTGPGPLLLELRDIGAIFVSSCPDFVLTSELGLTYRNTSTNVVDVPGAAVQLSTLNAFLPGEEVPVNQIARTGQATDAFLYTIQFAAGATKTTVATVTVSGLFDSARNECRFTGQATVVSR